MSKRANNRTEAIAKARARVERSIEPRQCNWLVGTPPDSYGFASYRCELQVLEGTPPRGFVLATNHAAVAISMNYRVLECWLYCEVL
ncbi:MAG: hypothetical protein WB249_02575 [Candidatus Sulfotelmatobacter sp.]|jgi:hypothetical protein